jgi:uncharacterized coiled-coil DUF342 family protein
LIILKINKQNLFKFLKIRKNLDELKDEIKLIDNDLLEVDEKIRLLEYERENLLKKKRQCTSRLKDLMPTSSGGTKSYLPAEWNQTSKYL